MAGVEWWDAVRVLITLLWWIGVSVVFWWSLSAFNKGDRGQAWWYFAWACLLSVGVILATNETTVVVEVPIELHNATECPWDSENLTGGDTDE